MLSIDLTPFGFTPTENAVYGALVERGPSGGYQLSNALGIARANIYQALRSLVAKDAAVLVSEKPAEYRAIGPESLYARIVDRQSALLEALERQIADVEASGEEAIVTIESRRSYTQVVLKDAARTAGWVTLVADSGLVKDLAPAWRKRQNDGLDTYLWVIGDDVEIGFDVAGRVESERVAGLGLSIYTSDKSVAFFGGEGQGKGFWSDEPLLVALAGFAIASITSA